MLRSVSYTFFSGISWVSASGKVNSISVLLFQNALSRNDGLSRKKKKNLFLSKKENTNGGAEQEIFVLGHVSGETEMGFYIRSLKQHSHVIQTHLTTRKLFPMPTQGPCEMPPVPGNPAQGLTSRYLYREHVHGSKLNQSAHISAP